MAEKATTEPRREESKTEPHIDGGFIDLECGNPANTDVNESGSTPSDDSLKLCACGCSFFILLLIYLPFIVCDLYFGYTHISCQDIVSSHMDLTIGTWLKVNGYLLVSMLFVPLFFPFIDEKNKCVTISVWVISSLKRIFVLSWLIVGAILFWRDIEPLGKCDKSVNSYIWARLIMGICGFAISLKMENDKKK
jgi:hypothetical protein